MANSLTGKSRGSIARRLAATVAAVVLAGVVTMPAGAAEPERNLAADTTRIVNLGVAVPTFTFRDASLIGAGTSMMSRGQAAIQIDNMVGRVRTSYIYWSYAGRGTPWETDVKIRIRRAYPNEMTEAVELTGERVGSWPYCGSVGNHIRVFRARVPTSVVDGNGIYFVAPDPANQGDIDGNGGIGGYKRWPIWFGASMFVIGTGSDTVALYDGATRNEAWDRLIAVFKLPAVSAPYRSVRLHQIGAGGSRTDEPSPSSRYSAEITVINGIRIAGPGSPSNDSDWNGAAAGQNLHGWDHSIHEVVRATEGSDYNRSRLRTVLHRNGADCIYPAAAAVAITPGQP